MASVASSASSAMDPRRAPLVFKSPAIAPQDAELARICQEAITRLNETYVLLMTKKRALRALRTNFAAGKHPISLSNNVVLNLHHHYPEAPSKAAVARFDALQKSQVRALTELMITERGNELDYIKDALDAGKQVLKTELLEHLRPGWTLFARYQTLTVLVPSGFENNVDDSRLANEHCPPVLAYVQCMKYVDYTHTAFQISTDAGHSRKLRLREASVKAKEEACQLEVITPTITKLNDLINSRIAPVVKEMKRMSTSSKRVNPSGNHSNGNPRKVQKNRHQPNHSRYSRNHFSGGRHFSSERRSSDHPGGNSYGNSSKQARLQGPPQPDKVQNRRSSDHPGGNSRGSSSYYIRPTGHAQRPKAQKPFQKNAQGDATPKKNGDSRNPRNNTNLSDKAFGKTKRRN